MDAADGPAETEPCCKVGRIVREYGLDGLDEELARRWTEQGTDSASVRELEREINRRLLRSALVDAGIPPIDGEAENLRRVLGSAETGESRRLEAQRRLESDGVDVDRVVDDFVSHQTVHNHLRDCRKLSPPDGLPDGERRSRAKSTVFGLRNRTEAVTERTLSQLAANGLVSPGEFDVVVDVQAICEHCGRSHDVGDLVERGGCECT